MSSKAKWKESFQKSKSLSQTSLSTSLPRKTSLLEGDLSFSDEELQQYLGTIKKKSGLSRLWTGNTFDKVIDRTPDVSISSVSDGEVPIDEDNKAGNSDNDFLPNVMAFPSKPTEGDSKVSEPSTIRPFQAVNLMSDLQLSDAPLKLTDSVKLPLNEHKFKHEASNDIETANCDITTAEEIQTVDEVSEEIEEDINSGLKENLNYSNSKMQWNRSKEKTKSDRTSSSCYDNTSRSTRGSKSRNKPKHNPQYSNEDSSPTSTPQSQRKTQSKTERSRHSKHITRSSSRKKKDSYRSDFSECSELKATERTKRSSSYSRSAISSTKVTSPEEMDKNTSNKDKLNQCYHEVSTQVNMDDLSRQKLRLGMATLGPSFGHHYVDPSPIAYHLVDADAIEAVTAYNPAVIALTDMLRQQLRLVEQFVDNSRRMYEAYTKNLNTTYRYTTLEDTLQYIDDRGESKPGKNKLDNAIEIQ